MKSKSTLRINDEIKTDKIRLINHDGEQLGVVDLEKGLEEAQKNNLDLVEVSPEADPPVCRIMDYGKYRYATEKKVKQGKKRQKAVGLKEIKMRPNIGEHDYEFKTKNIHKFLQDGNRVKVTIMFKGREMKFIDAGRELLERVITETNEISKVEKKPKLEGRNMTLILISNINT
ncbi:MAG: translation initiation factor IF-3 [Atribacterota bacterium]|nr:translation initiation factor IF-3 [Atribacterota bacterium]